MMTLCLPLPVKPPLNVNPKATIDCSPHAANPVQHLLTPFTLHASAQVVVVSLTKPSTQSTYALLPVSPDVVVASQRS